MRNCAAYGFQTGTTAHAHCMQMETRERNAENRRAWRELGQSLEQFGRTLPTKTVIPSPPPINCTTSYVGRTAYTNCN